LFNQHIPPSVIVSPADTVIVSTADSGSFIWSFCVVRSGRPGELMKAGGMAWMDLLSPSRWAGFLHSIVLPVDHPPCLVLMISI
jgi:hypothetical protein